MLLDGDRCATISTVDEQHGWTTCQRQSVSTKRPFVVIKDTLVGFRGWTKPYDRSSHLRRPAKLAEVIAHLISNLPIGSYSRVAFFYG